MTEQSEMRYLVSSVGPPEGGHVCLKDPERIERTSKAILGPLRAYQDRVYAKYSFEFWQDRVSRYWKDRLPSRYKDIRPLEDYPEYFPVGYCLLSHYIQNYPGSRGFLDFYRHLIADTEHVAEFDRLRELQDSTVQARLAALSDYQDFAPGSPCPRCLNPREPVFDGYSYDFEIEDLTVGSEICHHCKEVEVYGSPHAQSGASDDVFYRVDISLEGI